MASRKRKPANRDEKRIGRAGAFPFAGLSDLTRNAVAVYLVLSDQARPVEGDPIGQPNGAGPPINERIDELSREDQSACEACIRELSDVFFCWPSLQTIADLTPPASPGGRPPSSHSVKRWTAELQAAGWVMCFNRKILIDGAIQDKSRLFLIAKRHPWPVEMRTRLGAHLLDAEVVPDRVPGVTRDLQKKANHEEGTSKAGDVEREEKVEDEESQSLGAHLLGSHTTPRSHTTPLTRPESALVAVPAIALRWARSDDGDEVEF